jgi:hypothetical protein
MPIDLVIDATPINIDIISVQRVYVDIVEPGDSGGGSWGSITGTLSDQTDLQDALDAKQDALTIDTIPTDGSNNPVASNGVFDALALKADALGPDDNYVTDAEKIKVAAIDQVFTSAEKTKVANTSGTNSGDQTSVTGNAGNGDYSTKHPNH